MSTSCGALGPLHVEIGEPHVERVVPLRIELDLAVKRERAEQRDSRSDSQAPDVPLVDGRPGRR